MKKEREYAPGWPLILRTLGIFLAFAALALLLYWACLHHHKDVAAWGGREDPQAAVIRDGQTYLRTIRPEDPELSVPTFKTGDLLGEVKPSGKSALTTCFKVYAVKSGDKVREEYLLITGDDGETVLYFREDVADPYDATAPETESQEP